LNELQSSEKVVQQMTENGAVEINKASGDITLISAKQGEAAETVQISGEESFHSGDGINKYFNADHKKTAQKQAVKNANKEILMRGQTKPEIRTEIQKPQLEIVKPQPTAQANQTAIKPPKHSRLKFTDTEKVDTPAISSIANPGKPTGSILTVHNDSRLIFRKSQIRQAISFNTAAPSARRDKLGGFFTAKSARPRMRTPAYRPLILPKKPGSLQSGI